MFGVKAEKPFTSDIAPLDESGFGAMLFGNNDSSSSSSSANDDGTPSASFSSPSDLLHAGLLPLLSAREVDAYRAPPSLFGNDDEFALDAASAAASTAAASAASAAPDVKVVVFDERKQAPQHVELANAAPPSLAPPPPALSSVLLPPLDAATHASVGARKRSSRASSDGSLDDNDDDRDDDDDDRDDDSNGRSAFNNDDQRDDDGVDGDDDNDDDNNNNAPASHGAPKKIGRPRKLDSQRSKRAKTGAAASSSWSSSSSSPAVACAAPLQASLEASGYHPKRMRTTPAKSDDEDDALTPADEEANRIATIAAIEALPAATASVSAALSREALLVMTSDALDEWQTRLAAVRHLTPDDRRELQRQRRLVKNRESAQLSRQRKKGYIGQLELRLTDLSVAHDALKAKNAALERENAALRSELAATRGGASSVAPHVAPPRAASTASAASTSATTTGRSRSAVRAAAATLMLMLFSFGVFFHSPSLAPPPLADSAALVPVSSGGVAPISSGRVLLASRVATPSSSVGGSNASGSWIDEAPIDVDERTSGIQARHSAAAARFERPASLAQLLDVLPDLRSNAHARKPTAQRSIDEQQRRTVSEQQHDAGSVSPWQARRMSSGPVPNATYWYAPQLRSLRRGVDHNLLGLMVPLTAFDDDDALPRDEQSYSVLGDDDVPVLEVMCEVKSVLRTPFFASTFDNVVEQP